MRQGIRKIGLIVAGCSIGAFLAVCGPSGTEMLGDAMIDVGSAMTDAARDDAAAQEGCATCTGGGAMHVVTADTDPERLVRATVAVTAITQVVEGPFVLSDAQTVGGWGVLLSLSTTGDCSDAATRESVATIASPAIAVTSRDTWFIHGGRIWIAPGTALCADNFRDQATVLSYGGFRPYD